MNKKLLSITVRGKYKTWSFNFYEDPKYLNDWEADGLEVYQVENIIPEWVVAWGLMRSWIFFQDIINLRFLERGWWKR